MKRKIFICVGIVLLVVAMGLFLVQPQKAMAKKVTLTMEACWPAGSVLYENFLMFAKQVKEMSGGELIIKTLPAGAIVPPFEILDAVSRGVIDGGHSWASYWFGKNKAAALFTGGPGGTFGMDFTDYLGWMYVGGGLQLYTEFYQDILKMNVVVYPVMPAGPQSFGWFKKPIKSFDDMKKMKMRVGGLAGIIFTRAGVTTVNLPGGEILPAAERGVIDAAEWVSPAEDIKMGFHEVWKNYYLPGMHENVTVAEVIFNKDVWDKLPKNFQAIIRYASISTFILWQSKFVYDNSVGLRDLTEKYGVNVQKTPDEILYTFLKNWDEIAAEEAAKNPFFKKVFQSQKDYAGTVVPARMFMFPDYKFAGEYYWGKAKK